MSRLTKRHSDGSVGISQFRYYNYDDFQEMAEKLAEYEDLEEQGLLFKSPYKIGDIVYICIYKRIIKSVISCIEFRYDKKPFYRTYIFDTGEVGESFGIDDIDKIVFSTDKAVFSTEEKAKNRIIIY